jgi:hypothetical protein
VDWPILPVYWSISYLLNQVSNALSKYIPKEAFPLVAAWFREYNFHLRISKSRVSKLGDFRPAHKGKPHRISVNGDLNPYHFLITLTHEVAHVACWAQYQNKVNPHGAEWKSIYAKLLEELMEVVQFPSQLAKIIRQHLQSPKASSCSDPELYKALRAFDPPSSLLSLEELEEGTVFQIRGKRIFKKGKKRRTRFECLELATRKLYLVSAQAEVALVNHLSE